MWTKLIATGIATMILIIPNDALKTSVSEKPGLVSPLSVPFRAADVCYGCLDCVWGCHEMTDGPVDFGSYYHECQCSGSCAAVAHPDCTSGFALTNEQIAEVWNGVANGGGEQVLALAERYPHNVHINVGRRAVQVSSCGGLVAHIPLTAEQLAALE
ncbi:MAG TPA: hypothetical protein VF158_07390 [Longimicrobiales bacterium]